jgi:hypothetical protein
MTDLLKLDPMLAVRADEWRDKGRDDVADIMMGVLHPIEKPRKRIDKLTKAQVAAMKAHVERWVAIGRCTRPADRALFEAAVTECYRLSGLPAPRVQWCQSPIVAVLAGSQWASSTPQVRAQVDAQVREQVSAQIARQVKAQVRAQVDAQVREQVHAQVYAQVHEQVRAQVREQVSEKVHEQVRAQVRAQVDAQVREQVHAQVHGAEWWRFFGGQFWVGGWWGSPARASFLAEVCGLQMPDETRLRARAYSATCESACWWYPCRDVVFVSERPRALEFHDAAKTKLALASWDGWEVRR